jgi:SAM-dependent methyltransferase
MELAADWDAKFIRRPPPEDPIDAVVGRLTGLAPGRAVDLGCGGGRHARWLAEAGWTVDAVDWSDVGVDHGRKSAPAAITWTVGDVAQWQPTGPVDLVLLSYLHLPVEEMTSLLTRVRGWLSDRGVLLYLGHAPQGALAGPPLELRPSLAELAHAVSDLRVLELAHVLNPNGAGTVDIVLHVQRWDPNEAQSVTSNGRSPGQ